MMITQLLQWGVKELASAGIGEAETDVYLLLGHCLKKSRTELLLAANEQVPMEKRRLFRQYLARRVQREPVAYIVGEREFWSLPFHVSKDVLIPRPETEFLIETVLPYAEKNQLVAGPIADVCCGSGVIAVVLAQELRTRVIAIDISQSALKIAQKNCKRHQVDSLVSFVQADLLGSFRKETRFSLIVTNPPYVTEREMRDVLEPEVALYEPHLALNGGKRGLNIIKRLHSQLRESLAPGGQFFMEIGASQGEDVKKLFSSPCSEVGSFDLLEVIKDFSGRDRVVYGRLKA